MTSISAPLPVSEHGILISPLHVFSLKKTVAVGVIGIIASFALVSYVQKRPKSSQNQYSLSRPPLPLSERKIVVKKLIYMLGAAALISFIFNLQTLLKGVSSASMGLRLISQTSYSMAALVGIAVLVAGKIFITFFKVDFSLFPFKLSISRHKPLPRESEMAEEEITKAFRELTKRFPSSVTTPDPEGTNRTISTEASRNTSLVSNQVERFYIEGKSVLWLALPKDMVTRMIFPFVLKPRWAEDGGPEDPRDFKMFCNLALVCKTWREFLYSVECLVFGDKNHFFDYVFSRQDFDLGEMTVFYKKYLSPKKELDNSLKQIAFVNPAGERPTKAPPPEEEEGSSSMRKDPQESPMDKFLEPFQVPSVLAATTYQGEGLSLRPLMTSLYSTTVDQLIYLMDCLPKVSIDRLELVLREDDDAKKAGAALSTLLQNGDLNQLIIIPDKKQEPFPKSLLGKILNKDEIAERKRYANNCLKSGTRSAGYVNKLIELFEHTKGPVAKDGTVTKLGIISRLELHREWEDPVKCITAMKGMRITELYFFDPSSSFYRKYNSFSQGEGLRKLYLYEFPDGKRITQTLEATPQLKRLSLEQCYERESNGDDPLKGLSLTSMQLEDLFICVAETNIQHGELKTLLQTQTCLKNLELTLPTFKLLPTTFLNLPIENLTLSCVDNSSDESDLTKALAHIRPTLKTLMATRMNFTGSCLKGLQLDELCLDQIEGIQDDALREALLGRRWKRLIFQDIDITEACLKDVDVEELQLLDDIPRLDEEKLYQTLCGMKERGLKRLLIRCYKGIYGKSIDNGKRCYHETERYLSDFTDRLESDEKFSDVLPACRGFL
jgi:hypothetical protein